MKTLELVYDDYPDDTIVLRLSPVPLRVYFDLADRWNKITGEDVGELTTYLRDFAGVALVSWTFPEPADPDGFLERDYVFAKACIRDWLEQMREVAVPLPVGSSGIEPSPEPETLQPANRSIRRANSRGPKHSTTGSAPTPATR